MTIIRHSSRPLLRAATATITTPSLSHSFHTTSSPQFLSTVLSNTHTVLDTIHTTTHLPWVLALPLTALTLRLLIFLPMTVYLRQTTQRQCDLSPLLSSWTQIIRSQQMKQKRHLGPAVVQRDTAQAIRIKRRELYKRWNCGYWKSYLPITQLVVWLPVMEAIREKAGARSGILGLFMDDKEKVDMLETSSSAVDIINDVTPATTESFIRHVGVEPTFVTEGALWFPDLSASDPMLMLPFMLSATMFFNIYVSSRRSGTTNTNPSPRRRGLTTAFGIMALAAGPLTLQMPTGMLVYWISSMSIGALQNLAVDKYMPLRLPVIPCSIKTKRIMPKNGQVES